MATVVRITLYCDEPGCLASVASTVGPDPEVAAREAAVEWGWLLGDDGDWCAVCRGKAFD